jgi:hypothetical protein
LALNQLILTEHMSNNEKQTAFLFELLQLNSMFTVKIDRKYRISL